MSRSIRTRISLRSYNGSGRGLGHQETIMKRRDVLKAGVTGVASATVGCATTVHVGEVSTGDATSAHSFLATLDHHLALTASARFVDGYVAAQYPDRPRSIAAQKVIEDNDALFRRM